jgi:hypothetical protein
MAPGTVIVASILQFLLAAAFLIQTTLAYRYGAKAQRAAEAEVVKQGAPATVLAQQQVNFEERGVEIVLPVAIAMVLAALASLNLAGNGTGRILSWIFQPIVLVAGGLVMSRQVFAVRYLEAAFSRSGDATLQRLNVRAFVDAALGAFPPWFRSLVATRLVLATVGSLLVIALLATPTASAYFR